MAVTRQLFELQELDTEIENGEQDLALKTGQLGDRQVLVEAQDRLSSAEQHLNELKKQHRSAEQDLDSLLAKIAAAEGELYGGKVTNPKELSNLQYEVTTLKAKSDEIENTTLEIIERVEAAEEAVTTATDEYKHIEEEWQQFQQQLTMDIEKLTANLADLKQQRTQLSEQIEPFAVALYERIRQQKKQAVAKVEQGICRACRISLSASALQRARSGQPVQCGTCGRILYIS